MQTEAVAGSKSEASTSGKDPMLLGVSLPIAATVSAANQVKTAWLEAIAQVIAAARAKASEGKGAVAKKANGAVKAVESEINA